MNRFPVSRHRRLVHRHVDFVVVALVDCSSPLDSSLATDSKDELAIR